MGHEKEASACATSGGQRRKMSPMDQSPAMSVGCLDHRELQTEPADGAREQASVGPIACAPRRSPEWKTKAVVAAAGEMTAA